MLVDKFCFDCRRGSGRLLRRQLGESDAVRGRRALIVPAEEHGSQPSQIAETLAALGCIAARTFELLEQASDCLREAQVGLPVVAARVDAHGARVAEDGE